MSDENEPTVLTCGCPLQVVKDQGHQEGCGVLGWMERHGSEVQVAFTVPVEVVIDLATGRVAQVVTIDEAIKMDDDADGHPIVHTRTQYASVTAEDIRKVAGEIADDGDQDWPTWQAGW